MFHELVDAYTTSKQANAALTAVSPKSLSSRDLNQDISYLYSTEEQ